jgi:hypothetical protein
MTQIQSLNHLITSSKVAVESYELSQLNRASNLREEVIELLEKWVIAETEARIARSVLESKQIELDIEAPNRKAAYPNLQRCNKEPYAGTLRTDDDRLTPARRLQTCIIRRQIRRAACPAVH